MENLIDIQWLIKNQSKIKLIDASVKGVGNLISTPNDEQISSIAIRFDYETKIVDENSPWPSMMPCQNKFEREVKELGINNADWLVVFDNKGIYSAPRVWWMLKSMGHKQVAVLNGGLAALIEHKAQLSVLLNKSPSKELGDFSVDVNDGFIDETFIQQNPQTPLLDARAPARFSGLTEEPRVGLRAGHIPGALNLPFANLLENGQLKNKQELQKAFDQFPNLKKDEPIIFSCGSGVTACILALAADQMGYQNLKVYDGSWSQWGAMSELEIET